MLKYKAIKKHIRIMTVQNIPKTFTIIMLKNGKNLDLEGPKSVK